MGEKLFYGSVPRRCWRRVGDVIFFLGVSYTPYLIMLRYYYMILNRYFAIIFMIFFYDTPRHPRVSKGR